MTQLRIALTISGAVSLGAYEGGALAALLVAVQQILGEDKEAIRVDAISGASAGSIVALLTSRALLGGLDPVHVMYESWVKQPSLQNMQTRDPHAPLSVETLRNAAIELLDPPEKYRGRPTQAHSIKVRMTLASLRGLTYKLARLKGDPIDSSTYLDWGTFTFDSKMDAKDYQEPNGASPLDFALASGANAFGFPPKALNRKVRPEDLKTLERGEIIDLPTGWSGWLWYTDGGTIENEPLGQTLDLANELDRDHKGKRLHLLVHPHPSAPPKNDAWTVPARQPPWITTLARADRIQRTQGLYEDLRRAEKTNSRLEWKDRMRTALHSLLEKDPDSWTAALKPVFEKAKGEKVAIDSHAADAIEADPVSTDLEASQLLDELIELVTGLGGKETVAIDVVSPLILPEANQGTTVEDLLAGEFLGHFGGFLDENLRIHDFSLGYRSMLHWLPRLVHHGVSEANATAAINAAKQHEPKKQPVHHGSTTFRDLPLSARMGVYRVAAHLARVVLGELLRRGKP